MPATAELECEGAERFILCDDAALRLYGQVVVWFQKDALFRRFEDQHMYRDADPSEAELHLHKTLLEKLIAEGEKLLAAANGEGLQENPERITAECIAATLYSLQDTLRSWHHNSFSPEQRAKLVLEIFGDVS
jgi:hypothetical protein